MTKCSSEEMGRCNEILLKTLLNLPPKILHNHDIDGLSQIVLHEIGHIVGFSRASYLIDSPDFDYLKGVAGFCHNECKMHPDDVWNNPQAFSEVMNKAEFHSQIKNFSHHSVKKACTKKETSDIQTLQELGKTLGIAQPQAYSLQTLHGNHGILLYQDKEATCCSKSPEILEQICSLLALCSH